LIVRSGPLETLYGNHSGQAGLKEGEVVAVREQPQQREGGKKEACRKILKAQPPKRKDSLKQRFEVVSLTLRWDSFEHTDATFLLRTT
jgi:hypothetical protein